MSTCRVCGVCLPPVNGTSIVPGSVEWCAWIATHASRIYVRVQVSPMKWENVALSTLDPEQQAGWVEGWLRTGRVPVRVL